MDMTKLQALFEKHPAPWHWNESHCCVYDANGMDVFGRAGDEAVAAINAAAPAPPFVPGLYPVRQHGCEPWVTRIQDKGGFDALKSWPGVEVGQRIDPVFPK